jgi:hypothetical protein
LVGSLPALKILPETLTSAAAEVVRLHTTLEADLSQVGRGSIVKKNTIWSLGSKKPAVKVHFLIEAVVGIADVKFRCREYLAELFLPISWRK